MLAGFVFYCIGIVFWCPVKCNPITNAHFNEEIREFSTKDDGFNSSNAKTLLKEAPELYANYFTPIRSPVKFKALNISPKLLKHRPLESYLDVDDRNTYSQALLMRKIKIIQGPRKYANAFFQDLQDNAQSSSSYSRGLIHNDHPEYTVHEYEAPYDYGHDHYFPDHGYHHGYDHHSVDHYGHHGYHGDTRNHYHDHHKYHHGLAVKTVLWPIAGLALLGAAAALVTNPILLQIGVASGKRRRRDTEEDLEPNVDIDRWSIREDSNDASETSENKEREKEKSKTKIKQRLNLLQKRNGLSYRRKKNKMISPTERTKFRDQYTTSYSTTPAIDNDNLFIPVPIKIKDVS